MSSKKTISRRGVLATLAGGSALAAVASSQAPTDSDSVGVGGQPGVLAIAPTETYDVPGGNTESYRAVNWADGGELVLDGTLKLTDQT